MDYTFSFVEDDHKDTFGIDDDDDDDDDGGGGRLIRVVLKWGLFTTIIDRSYRTLVLLLFVVVVYSSSSSSAASSSIVTSVRSLSRLWTRRYQHQKPLKRRKPNNINIKPGIESVSLSFVKYRINPITIRSTPNNAKYRRITIWNEKGEEEEKDTVGEEEEEEDDTTEGSEEEWETVE